MHKKLFVLLTIIILAVGFAFGEEAEMQLPPVNEIEDVISVMIDCISASFVSEYASPAIALPCTSVSMDEETNLPIRMSFFMADPADFVIKLSQYVSNNGSVLGSIRALFNKTADNPYISAAYLSMASKGYEANDYFFTGSVVFSYPQGSDVDKIESVWLLKDSNIEHLLFNANMTFYGLKVSQSITINGWLELYADNEGIIHVNSYGPVSVNGIEADKIEFTL